MRLKWKSGFKPELILEKINQVRRVLPDGRASYAGLQIFEYKPVLQSMLCLCNEASTVDLSEIVSEALSRVKGELNQNNFLKAANDIAKINNSVREIDYQVLTTISINRSNAPPRLELDGVIINFLKGDFPKKFNSRNDEIARTHPASNHQESEYTRVIIKLRSKSPKSAVGRALRALDLLRAIWCLISQRSMELTFGHTDRPINSIRTGQFHTIHTPEGTALKEHLWFEPRYVAAPAFSFNDHVKVHRQARILLKRLDKLSYRDRVVKALTRFAGALDESDFDTAFLRLWSATESLAAHSESGQDTVIKRCAALWSDPHFHLQVLLHLRSYRNSNVHETEYRDHSRLLCYQMRRYFAALTLFHINHGSIFGSFDSANRFLDAPWEEAKLIEQVKIAKRAIRWRR